MRHTLEETVGEGISVLQILIRFPNGLRKRQNFLISETIRSTYKYIDSQDVPGIGSYQLVSFPKRIYSYEQLDMTLRDADSIQMLLYSWNSSRNKFLVLK